MLLLVEERRTISNKDIEEDGSNFYELHTNSGSGNSRWPEAKFTTLNEPM